MQLTHCLDRSAPRRPRRIVRLGIETLEQRTLLAGQPVISEFMATNDQTLDDGDGRSSDWVEIFNAGDEPIDLVGWHLTDEADNLDKWTFPSVVVGPDEYLLVFASGKPIETYVDLAGNLHTDFELTGSGEYLALVHPDDQTVVSEFAPTYPPQVTDVSFGPRMQTTETPLIDGATTVEVLVPTNGALGNSWTLPDFTPDASWIDESAPGVPATLGVGFDTGGSLPNIVGQWPLDDAAGSGLIADVADNGHNGTAVGGVTLGLAGAIPGTSTAAEIVAGSIDVPYSAALNPGSFTVTAWANPAVGSTGTRTVVASRQQMTTAPVSVKGFVLQANALSRWEFLTGDDSTADGPFDVLVGPAATRGVWTHLAISFDATTQTKTLYVNGVAAATTTAHQYVPNIVNGLHIGGGGDLGTSSRFNGLIDDVSLWNTVLGPGDIQAIMADGVPLAEEVSYTSLIQTDVQDVMLGVSGSAYVRVPFDVTNPADFGGLLLRVRYDDGFAAYLNGVEVARRNAPVSLAWNSQASGTRSRLQASVPEEFDLRPFVDLLVPGENVLAIHALNSTPSDGAFLVFPELAGISTELADGESGYFLFPSPRQANPASHDEIGPYVNEVVNEPNSPDVTQPLVVSARITPLGAPVASATLRYRVMYGAEVDLPMTDNGTSGDAAAGDGVYTAVIPAGVAQPGQMIRYFITAVDSSALTTREPRILDTTGDDQSPQYHGTIVRDPALTSQLPIFHWFTQNEASADTRTGARASVFYNGEFYDNIFVRQRGAATSIGSQKFDFNEDVKKFFVNDVVGAVEEINLNSNGSDPTFIRQTLSFDTIEAVGNPSLESFLVLMRVNDNADRVGVFIEQPDEDYLERQGFDPNGALYKFVQRGNLNPVFADTTTGVEKKTRLDEDFSDLQEIVTGLALPTVEARRNFVFDNFDVPNLINYLAARAILNDADDVRKNFYLYRDTEGDRLWRLIPWDKDWSYGVQGDGGAHLAHPFFGEFEHLKQNANQWNVLWDVVFGTPETKTLYLRRVRTLMDEFLKPAGTPAEDLVIEPMISDLFSAAAPHLGAGPAAALPSINAFLGTRRNQLFNVHSIDNQPTPTTTLIDEYATGVRYFVPTSDSLGTTWTAIDFLDGSWTTGQTGLGYQNQTGVVTCPIDPAGDYASLLRTCVKPQLADSSATSIFARLPFTLDSLAGVSTLSLQLKYDDAFIAYINGVEVARMNVAGAAGWNSASTNHPNGSASAFENFVINVANLPPGTLRAGGNVLAIHALNTNTGSSDMLLLPKLLIGNAGATDVAGIPHAQVAQPAITFGVVDYNPASMNQDEEYIELVNANADAIDISGWKLTGGVDFTFAPGTVILPDSSLYVSPDVAAFRARTTGPSGNQGLLVVGGYDGHVSNFGETILLVAPDDTTIATVTTPSTPSDVQQFLRITEVMYHPAGPTPNEMSAGWNDGDLFEYVELENINDSQPLQLEGTRFTGGVTFEFGDYTLAPGGHVLVVSNQAAFEARYGASRPIAGQYAGNLSNGGEPIRLDDFDNSSIHDFSYDDDGIDWHPATDGSGYSLVIGDPAGDLANWDLGTKWRPSFEVGGSPGERDLMLGDFDSDQDVDLNDLAYLQSRMGAAGATKLTGDLTGDMAVGRADVARFARGYGRSFVAPSMPSPAAAPHAIVQVSSPRLLASREPGLSARRRLSPREVSAIDEAVTTMTTSLDETRSTAGLRAARKSR